MAGQPKVRANPPREDVQMPSDAAPAPVSELCKNYRQTSATKGSEWL